MGVRGQLNKIREAASSLGSHQDELSEARDEILQGADPRDVASNHGVHPSDLAERFERRGEEELQKAEEGETQIRNGVTATENKLDKIGSKEVENPDLAEYENYLQKAENRLEEAEEGEEKIAEATKDAERYFKASMKIADTSETQVGSRNASKNLQEAENFEDRIRQDIQSVEGFRELVDRCWKKIDDVSDERGDSGMKKQEEAVENVAGMIHNKLN
jgi:hypothetical protein